jgi:GNAT superfamily N-acetyltransferase
MFSQPEDLEPLPPDLLFLRLPSTEEALLSSFEVKKDALGPHISVKWGWDEAHQMQIHRQRFLEKPIFYILMRGEMAGTLSWELEVDHIRFGEFYLLNRYRNMGWGTRIPRHLVGVADRLERPVRLEYLKWNPVGSLYRRLGFQDRYATDLHYHLERPVHRQSLDPQR